MKQHYVLLHILFFLFCSVLHAEKPRLRVAVVGGGMAGVAAAHYIHSSDPDAQVCIFEKEARLGGNARTVLVNNRRRQPVAVDAGPPYFTEGPCDEYIRFLKARKDLYIGGGWAQGLETQETALISGRKAMDKYIRFKAEES